MAFIGFRISDSSKDEIKALAKDLNTTVSDIARELLADFMKHEKENDDE